MITPDPKVRLTREEIAKREIGHTEISRGLAWLMTVVFLLTLIAPPTVQLLYDTRYAKAGEFPSAVELFPKLTGVAEVFSHSEGTLWNRTLSANHRLLQNIEQYENQLEERSLMTRRLLGPTQLCLTSMAGLGNEQAYAGRNGWIFYRPDVDYLTGPGFLSPAILNRRETSVQTNAAPRAADPRQAILEFHQQLAQRGIRLILMPTPGKAAIYPDQLTSRFEGHDRPLENRSFEQFHQEMQKAGVLMFDPAPLLARRKPVSRQFLQSDTHWTPEAIEFVAGQLKEFIEHECPLPAQEPIQFRERMMEVENLGDIAVMLHLPESQTLFPREKVTIRQVLQPDGPDWRSDESADVLLLGDSYSNIYSLNEMHWGTGAGLAERLSFVLHRPVDRLAQNDGGAYGVRQALFQELARGNDRLAGKRIVIWEFAVRELAMGDWKQIPIPTTSPDGKQSPGSPSASAAGELVVRATIRSAAGAPQPGTVPYRDAVTSAHLVDLEVKSGSLDTSEIVVHCWGMRDNRWTNSARWSAGQKLTLRLVPWEDVAEKYGRFNRIELDDPDFKLIDLPIFWAEELP
jgi:hypothetical protein